MNNLIGILEAIIFASGSPITRSEIFDQIPDQYSKKDFSDAIDILKEKYSGDCGILLEVFNDKLQFASNSKYGQIVSDTLQPVKEKELTNILMECLAIIAYRQPVTRGEIEEIRGVSADYALTTLSRCNMVKQKGYKNSPGHPALFVTTDEFLKRFGLTSLDEMPDYATIMKRLADGGNFNEQTEGLYKEVKLFDGFEEETTSFQEQQSKELDMFIDTNEVPDFLQDELISSFEGDAAQAVAYVASDIVDEQINSSEVNTDAFEPDSDEIGV